MPMVNGRKFKYDKAGEMAAMKEAAKTGKPMKKTAKKPAKKAVAKKK
jgi:hypothetical protein